ncbi:MAG: hypothetical protein WEB60_03240 [Terrimicrobiaceae bacterium]
MKQTETAATAQNDTRDFAPLFGGGEIKRSSTFKAVTPFGLMLLAIFSTPSVGWTTEMRGEAAVEVREIVITTFERNGFDWQGGRLEQSGGVPHSSGMEELQPRTTGLLAKTCRKVPATHPQTTAAQLSS